MKLKINKEKCIGCGQCVSICNNVYDFDDDNLAKVVVDSVKEEDLEDAEMAKDACPAGAIEEVKEK